MRKKTLSKKIELGMNSLVILIGIFIAMMTLAFLVHSNKTATTGYQLSGLKARRMDLIVDIEVNDMKIAESTSINNILSEVEGRMTTLGDPEQMGGFTVLAAL